MCSKKKKDDMTYWNSKVQIRQRSACEYMAASKGARSRHCNKSYKDFHRSTNIQLAQSPTTRTTKKKTYRLFQHTTANTSPPFPYFLNLSAPRGGKPAADFGFGRFGWASKFIVDKALGLSTRKNCNGARKVCCTLSCCLRLIGLRRFSQRLRLVGLLQTFKKNLLLV